MLFSEESPEIDPDDAVSFGDVVERCVDRICVKQDAEWSKSTGQSAAEYQKYLKTPHWRTVSRLAKWRAGHRCQLCNADDKPLETHHRTYERIGEELDGDVIVLCDECHDVFHKNRKLASQ
jgi:hypothetical protein